MNSCVLMAEIVQAPELRYTQDGQTAIAEMVVQFPALRAEDPMETIKVVGWGNLGQAIQEQFQVGEQVIIEGRLNMNVVDRPEGFKEKKAELTVSRIHKVQADLNAPRIANTPPATRQPQAQPAPAPQAAPQVPPQQAPSYQAPSPAPSPAPSDPAPDTYEPNYDDIPF